MDNLDGQLLNRMKQWKCKNGHVMGVIERVRTEMQVNGKSLRYFTTRLMLFRRAVDLNADVPAEIDVAGYGDGRILSIVWRCSECDEIREWHPESAVAEFLATTYLAE
jgi:hypothetical protein